MKQMKKLASLLLALVLVLSVSVTALADSGYNDNSGAITIDNAVVGQTYTIYQLLTLESYNTETNAYAYKATAAWDAFINGDGINGTYVNVDEQGYVTWKEGANAADFAALAQAYAKENNIANQGSVKADSTTVKFTGLNLGYYLVDSSLGSLCSLDTTNPAVTIKEKNQEPTNEKQVEEDSTGNLGSENDADIGQMVKFVSTVTLPLGSENVTFHDKMSTGLTLVDGIAGEYGVTVYQKADLTDALPDGNYNVTARDNADGCTLEIAFKGDYLGWQTSDITLYVVYYAIVNENAVVGSNGNPNESWLNYGEDGTTTTVPSKTTTYTWEIDIYKYTVVKATEEGKADTEKALANAEFILYKDAASGDTTTRYYATAAAVDGGYRFTEWTTDETAATKFVTPDNGRFAIKGLDSDTYYLEETTAPAGYNELKAPVKVVINADGSVTYGDNNTAANPDVRILNLSGTELPSTGGIGTTIFYVIGSVLVAAAVVLLVTKKRMSDKA